jgi:CrcB protein
LNNIIYIGFGGFLGAIARYLITKYLNSFVISFPFGTLFVNFIGSLVIGFFLYSIDFGKSVSPSFRNFFVIGFIGAFTTMSSFAYESFRLLEDKEFLYFGLNLFLSMFLCLVAIYIGKELAILITNR